MEPLMNADERRSKAVFSATFSSAFNRVHPRLIFLCVVCCAVQLCRASNDDIYSHRFEYDPPAGGSPQAVVVAGDFNGWSQTATPMHRADGGAWVADVDLSEGAQIGRAHV